MSRATTVQKRKICLFSGKRGGFGAYFPLAKLIDSDPSLELQWLLGDMHASKEFGATANEVKKFFPRSKITLIDMGTGGDDSSLSRARNLGVCEQKAASALKKMKPDIVMVHADRGEHLMVGFAALNLGIPVFHTQGGEISGNIDDVQRHVIAKLAHFHFPETTVAAGRLRRLGEEAWRIKPVGSLYIDRIVKQMYADTSLVKPKYGLRPSEDFFIVIYHPDTYLTSAGNYRAARNIFAAVKSFGGRSLVIYPCSDPGYDGVLSAISEISDDPQFLVRKNIDNLDFLGLLAGAGALVGNSSCAFVEAPYLHLGAVNVGRRQEGRDREENIVDSDGKTKSIIGALKYVLEDKSFAGKLRKCGYRLGDGRAAEKIVAVLKKISLDEKLLRKKLI
ncbi:UDP-N-acetylglucosamine 2-epimerase (hydrolyzing) [Candidatus Uhrbacteria bacterium]|nr:UDP-N-acetylglucosamine 2-epimerase (hydrolyzing) [Candidatus Uhrbacteria bacterium]